ncbi:MAG: ROK family protein [Bacteroides sp.]|nr:ROK family protein [Bacteroides sp.]
MKNLVIDMGGTRLKIGLFADSELLQSAVVPACSQENFENTLRIIEQEAAKLLNSFSMAGIEGIGLSIPGIVHTKENRVISINEKYNDSIHFDLNAWAKKRWNAKLSTENDARAALAGEWQYGAGKGTDNLVMMTLGTGIGGAALIEGKLLHGKHFQAGCLGGHFCIDFQGERCNCGNLGCVETKGSSWVLPSIASSKGYKADPIDFKSLFTELEQGHTKAREILQISMDAWGACAVNLTHVYDPEKIIIGGGVMKSKEIILPHLRNWIKEYAWTPWGEVEVETAQLEDTAALYGMDYLLKTM